METIVTFVGPGSAAVIVRFHILFLDDAFRFLRSLDKKHAEKILFNMRRAQSGHDPGLFKKLIDDIWEFRTQYQGIQYRFLAFWDKRKSDNTLVVATHGLVKKGSTMPEREIRRAKQRRAAYFGNDA